MDRRAADLAPRTAAIAAEAASSTAGSASPAAGLSSAGPGQGERWMEPSCHHDQASSVTNGRTGANSRSMTDSAARSAVTAETAGRGPCSP